MKKVVLLFVFSIFILLAKAAAPEAELVKILGTPYFNSGSGVGTTLTGHYYFDDPEIDEEGVSLYQWYRDGVAISGATDIRYELVSSDLNSDITFSVTPVDVNGEVGANVVTSAVSVSAISVNDVSISNNQTVSVPNDSFDEFLNVSAAANATGLNIGWRSTLHVYGDLDLSNVNGFNLIANGSIIVHGKLIVKNSVTIFVHDDAVLEVKSGIYAKNGANIDIDGNASIGGDLILEGNATVGVHFDRTLDIGGDVYVGDLANVTINGDVNASGDFHTGAGSSITTHWDTELVIGGDVLGSSPISGDGDVSVGGVVVPPASLTNTGSKVVLPIELVYFIANTNGNNVEVLWQTASEENNDYFTIERSSDGIVFEPIAEVYGAGNSSVNIDYNYIDKNPIEGVSYYRLKQADYNGDSETFDIVSVSYGNKIGLVDIEIENNSGDVTYNLGTEYSEVNVEVYSISGNLEFKQALGAVSSFSLDINNISGNMLIVRIYNSIDLNYVHKVAK